MSWREDLALGIVRVGRIFVGEGLGIESNLVGLSGRATIAQVNAGLVIAPAQVGRAYKVLAAKMRAIGGAVTSATLVRIMSDTNVVLSCTQASMTQNAWVNENTAGAVSTQMGVQEALNKALTIDKTGSAITVATHIDYVILYQLM